MRSLPVLLLVCLAPLAQAAPRVWTSSDGQRRFEADFVKQEGGVVTLRRSNGTLVSVEVARLHADDQKWLQQNQPAAAKQTLPVSTGVFDTLNFGDSHADVQKKLMASQVVATELDERFFGRTGLNGIFKTRKPFGGLRASLFFGWDESNCLNEVALHTDGVPLDQYQTTLKQCRELYIAELVKLYGQPVQGLGMQAAEQLEEGSILSTHLWNIPTGGSILVGTGKEKGQYLVIIRFTQQPIQPTAKANH